MTRFISILVLFALYHTPIYADKLLKNGFLNTKMDYAKEQNINDPKNKIILIYNHGQNSLDGKGSDCTWVSSLRNKVNDNLPEMTKDYGIKKNLKLLTKENQN